MNGTKGAKHSNIVYIYADDMGRGLLSCYGQRIIRTENIDRLAERGIRFTNFCSNAFCAPARMSLITGRHDCHAGQWTYTPGAYYKRISTGECTFEQLQETLQHLGPKMGLGEETIATLARKAGYVTGQIGKLEWGFSTTALEMEEHGWDYHFGYYDHIQAHGYYPPFLIENGRVVPIEGNTDPHCGRPEYPKDHTSPGVAEKDMTGRARYSQDLFDEKILEFLRAHRDEPFFLYHPSQLPHGLVFYPELHPQVAARADLTQTEKEYASMVLRLDETVGRIVSEIERLGLSDSTLILFASDNGHTVSDYQLDGRCRAELQLDGLPVDDRDRPFRTATCGDVFDGNDGMAGLKFSNWNGGCVVPLIAVCPGLVPESAVCDRLAANYDTLATFADLFGLPRPAGTDGVSFLPLLKGQKDAELHDHVVYASDSGPALVDREGWKLRVHVPWDLLQTGAAGDLTHDPRVAFQLYDLRNDFAECNDIAVLHPERVLRMKRILLDECDGNLYNATPLAHQAFPVLRALTWPEIAAGGI
jgi:arylsulfatase A-like enzyme